MRQRILHMDMCYLHTLMLFCSTITRGIGRGLGYGTGACAFLGVICSQTCGFKATKVDWWLWFVIAVAYSSGILHIFISLLGVGGLAWACLACMIGCWWCWGCCHHPKHPFQPSCIMGSFQGCSSCRNCTAWVHRYGYPMSRTVGCSSFAREGRETVVNHSDGVKMKN